MAENSTASSGVEPPAFLNGPSETSSGSVVMTWGESSTPEVTYELEYRVQETETWSVGYDGPNTSATIRIAVDGNYELRVRACLTSSICSAYTPPHFINVSLVFPNYLSSECPGPIPTPIPAQENVGAVVGQGAANGGAATYSIPIVVPPGRRGVMPSVSLEYASGSSNGLAGMGWSLSAASKISRCGRTPIQDGQRRAVDFTGADRLCMNGQRLVLTGGQYGLSGSTYQTEQDTLDPITLHGDIQSFAAGSGAWFEVAHKAGHRSFYGAYQGRSDTMEFLTDAPAPTAWWIAETRDPQQNGISYAYRTYDAIQLDDRLLLGQHVVDSIRYTSSGAAAGDREVVFIYDERADKSTAYHAGAMSRTTRILTAIETSVAGSLVRRYELEHTPSRATKRSLLTSVAVCTSRPCTSSTSLPATTFEYQDELPSFEWVDLSTDELVSSRLGEDYDGDGTRDVFETVKAAPLGATTASNLHLSGSGAAQGVLNGPWWAGFERRLNGLTPWNNTDFDQDGITDLIGTVSSGGSAYFAIYSNGATRLSDLVLPPDVMYAAHVGDFDGNGRSDLLWGVPGSGYTLSLQDRAGALQFTNNSAPFPAVSDRQSVKMIADFDGNGLADAYIDWSGAMLPPNAGDVPRIVFTAVGPTGLTFQSSAISTLGGPTSPSHQPGQPQTPQVLGGVFVDINGDGLLDVRSPGDRVFINVGGSFRPAGGRNGNPNESEPRRRPIQVDVNADGRMDTLHPGDVVFEWCAQRMGTTGDGGYDLPYCSNGTGGTRDFSHQDAPTHLDRTIREWDVYSYHDDGAGQFTVSVRSGTGIVAATGHLYVEDHGGDGLADVGSMLQHLYAFNAQNVPIETGWYAPNQGMGSYGSKVSRQTGGSPDLLVRVEDGLGVESRWTYAPLSAEGDVEGCTSPSNIPFYRVNHASMANDHDRFHFRSSMHIVAKHEQSNGIGGLNPTCYRYEDALFDNQGRGFLGFEKTITEEALPDDPNNLRITTTHRLGFPWQRVPVEQQVHLASDPETALPIEETFSEWAADCHPSADATSLAERCLVRRTATFQSRRDLERRTWITTSTTTFEYDPVDRPYGNISAEEAATEGVALKHSVRTEFVYDYSDAAAGWTNKLREKTVRSASVEYQETPVMAAAAHPENSVKVVRESLDFYPLGDPRARLPKRVEVQKGVPNEWVTTDYVSYDLYGNLTRQEVTAADAPVPRASDTAYAAGGYFVAATTNPLGHTATYPNIDPASGQPLRVVDENGHEAAMTIDEFGQVLDVVGAGKPTVYRRMRWCTSCLEHGVYEVIARQDGAPTHVEVKDALGRTIQVRETAFDPQQEVISVVRFDARGRQVEVSEPSYSAGGDYFMSYEGFDALGRPARRVIDRTGHVDSSGAPDESLTVDYTYSGLTTTIVLDGVRTMRRRSDALGRLLESVDAAGQRTVLRHDPIGRTILIEDPDGNTTRAGFDSLGRKLWMDDPDRGLWTFRYDGHGQLREQLDANQTSVEFVYDSGGRVTERMVNGAPEARYVYDVSGAGLAHSEEKFDNAGTVEALRTFEYDFLHRPFATTEQFDGQTYRSELAYDCHGNVRGMAYPGGESIDLWYDSYGHLLKETSPRGFGPLPELYREVLATNARGQVTRERFGNGLEGLYEYIDSTGDVARLCVGDMADPCTDARQDLRYGYEDRFGNLSFVEKAYHDQATYAPLTSVRERYTYDALFRLREARRSWTGTGQPDEGVNYDYDGLGNLRMKTDYATDYLYGDASRSAGGNAGPHAVRSVTKPGGQVVSDFTYDDNGNQTAGDGRTIQYTWMNKPEVITEGGLVTQFLYGPNHTRYRQDSPGRMVRYVGGSYEEVIVSGALEEKSYVGSSVLIIQGTGLNREVKYLHRDRLGSVESITNGLGELVESHGFDAFGQPRTSRWEDAGGALHNGEFASESTTRGFTGHEHLDAHRLVHMNGRAYDPALGRFLSVDPYIQDPTNLQALNPYSYVANNPLMGTDPSGYSSRSVCGESNRSSPCTGGPSSVDANSGVVIDGDGKVTHRWDHLRDTDTGKELIAIHEVKSGNTTYFNENDSEVNPSNIGGSLADGRREIVNLANNRKNAHRQREQYRSGDPAWERTKRLGAIYGGLLTFGPPALVLLNQVLEGLALVAAARLGPRALAAKEILMDVGYGLVEQTAPRAALAGAGMAGAGVVDDVARASKPMLAEADEAARLGGRGAEAAGEAARAAPTLLAQFTATTVDDVASSAGRLSPGGKITEGARAIAKKLGHAQSGGYTSAFAGIKPISANAEAIIRSTLQNPTRTFYGDRVIDVYNAAGQGVRFDGATNTFRGFLEATRATQ